MAYGIIGHRHVKQYRLKDDTAHWSLWEYQADGEHDTMSSTGRTVRVGTAHTEAEVAQFLGNVDQEIVWVKKDLAKLEKEWFEKMAILNDLETLQTV